MSEAFPRPYSLNEFWDYPHEEPAQRGMTMRQYYAAAALIGRIASGVGYPGLAKEQARVCFEMADAMIAEEEGRDDE